MELGEGAEIGNDEDLHSDFKDSGGVVKWCSDEDFSKGGARIFSPPLDSYTALSIYKAIEPQLQQKKKYSKFQPLRKGEFV